MRLSVRHRMLGAFLVAWLVFAVSGMVWLQALLAPAEALQELVQRGQRHDSLVATSLDVQKMLGLLPEIRGGDAVARAEFRKLGAQAEQNLQSLKQLSWSAEDSAALKQAHKDFHVLQTEANAASSGRRRGGAAAIHARMVKTLDRLLTTDTAGLRSRGSAVEQVQSRLTWLFGGCLLLALAVCIGLWHVLARSVTGPIERIARATRPISEGQLSTRIPIVSNDEIGQLTEAFNDMMGHLEGNFLGVAEAWALAVDAKSPWTHGHSHRVTQFALDTAQQLNLDNRTMSILRYSGLLHDIGKIGVPDEILDKPGRLTEEEFERMKQHTVIGHKVLSPIPFFQHMLDGVRHHHERYDGKGYPDGLAGEDIPFLARLLAVSDAFDAMTSDRPYRSGMPEEKALRILAEDNGEQWDLDMVEAFMRTRDPRLSRVRQPSDSLELPVPVEAARLPPSPAVANRRA